MGGKAISRTVSPNQAGWLLTKALPTKALPTKALPTKALPAQLLPAQLQAVQLRCRMLSLCLRLHHPLPSNAPSNGPSNTISLLYKAKTEGEEGLRVQG